MPGARMRGARVKDRRSYQVALVADRYLNPPRGGLDAVPVLLEAGWGAIQLPSDAYPDHVAAPLLEQVAEHVDEFVRNGYDVVLIGARRGVDEALAVFKVARLDRIEPKNARSLAAFLAKRRPPRRPRH